MCEYLMQDCHQYHSLVYLNRTYRSELTVSTELLAVLSRTWNRVPLALCLCLFHRQSLLHLNPTKSHVGEPWMQK